MNLMDAQADMRRSYADGGPGVMVSGAVWLIAALVAASRGTGVGFAALFVGGMLIFPIGALIVRLGMRRAKEAPGNQLGRTALESTIPMIASFLPAWLMLTVHPAFVFPFAAIVVGGRYFVFRTIYGDATYWLLGALILGAAMVAVLAPSVLPFGVAFVVAAIELILGAVLTRRALTT